MGNNSVAGMADGAQVFVEPEPEAQHTEIEKEAYWQHEASDDVEPLASERTGMGVGGYNRIVVQFRKNHLVGGVTEIVDSLFQLFVDFLDALVVAFPEEYFDGIRPVQQFVFFGILVDVAVDMLQHLRILHISRVFDDNLLAIDVALGTYAEYLHRQALVEVDVEDDGVVVGLVGEEGCNRSEDYRGNRHTEPDGPLVLAGHSEAGVVEDIVDDEDEYRHDDGYAETSLSDDGSQRGSNEEEDDTGQ